MPIRTIVIKERQTVWDLAVQEYGSVEGISQLMDDNPNVVTSLDQDLLPGTRIKITSEVVNEDVVNFYRENSLEPVSEVTDNAQIAEFSDDFSNDFFI